MRIVEKEEDKGTWVEVGQQIGGLGYCFILLGYCCGQFKRAKGHFG